MKLKRRLSHVHRLPYSVIEKRAFILVETIWDYEPPCENQIGAKKALRRFYSKMKAFGCAQYPDDIAEFATPLSGYIVHFVRMEKYVREKDYCRVCEMLREIHMSCLMLSPEIYYPVLELVEKTLKDAG